ncbi:hypothetical protein G6F70_004363 [Rhizopus microsporus]|nr:hypothetical protein G6F71_001951 [Rhizopus microsporus]KAG1200073.1 hypothetical protein G6F70_004363 [Rhizopus microsporus]KAG1209249.1 hypothetical protein G6F69_006523 [Rhizopus microsporus]KAG1233717.1 hypothetical protein G6F67_004073 [Rhizopus microsporus]KAG1267490.1 hypothetical protein G6F68_001911 [Rhizopus microsporus]
MDLTTGEKRKADELERKAPEIKKPNIQHLVREPSILHIRPVDDIIKYIADFIGNYCHYKNVEIEAKFGIFVDRRTNRRINLNALTETILQPEHERNVRFQTNMSLEQHRHFNKLLNDMVNKTQAKDYKGERIRYKHTNEIDKFYDIPNSKGRWRVTVDQQGQIVPNGIIEKERVADLNVHAPNQPLDFRISINVEHPRPKPNMECTYERVKDRISYQHGGISFDLTQVKSSKEDSDPRHELELEFADSKLLAAERLKYSRKEQSHYTQMIEVFVNNIRVLGRSALKQ